MTFENGLAWKSPRPFYPREKEEPSNGRARSDIGCLRVVATIIATNTSNGRLNGQRSGCIAISRHDGGSRPGATTLALAGDCQVALDLHLGDPLGLRLVLGEEDGDFLSRANLTSKAPLGRNGCVRQLGPRKPKPVLISPAARGQR